MTTISYNLWNGSSEPSSWSIRMTARKSGPTILCLPAIALSAILATLNCSADDATSPLRRVVIHFETFGAATARGACLPRGRHTPCAVGIKPYRYPSAIASRAAARVMSMSAGVWAAETNSASNWLQGR